jgi:transposase-like protein
MGRFRGAANGKRLFTTEFKWDQVGQVLRGEVSIVELSRELECEMLLCWSRTWFLIPTL